MHVFVCLLHDLHVLPATMQDTGTVVKPKHGRLAGWRVTTHPL